MNVRSVGAHQISPVSDEVVRVRPYATDGSNTDVHNFTHSPRYPLQVSRMARRVYFIVI